MDDTLSVATTCGPRRASVAWTAYNWVHVFGGLLLGVTAAVLIGWPARLLGDRHARVAHACLAMAFRVVVRLHPRYRLTLSGLENLPPGGAVLCPNHQSLADVVFLFSLPVGVKWVIKRELYWVPFFGAAMRAAGYLKIARGDSESALGMLATAQRYLAAGIPIVTFPEGTRSRDGELQRFHSGAARIAIAAQVPLVPIGVVGTAHLLPRHRFSYPAHGDVAIHIGAPISTAGATTRDARALTRFLREGVIAAKRQAALAGQS